MKKYMRKNKVISLIILVITIIVILVTVGLVSVTSQDVTRVKYETGEMVKKLFAVTVAENTKTYYGATVTNYTTGDSIIDSQVDWKIFHSDGKNIYLITTDYISGSIAPVSKTGTTLEYIGYEVAFNKIYSDYNGSENIIDKTLQNLNKKYHEYLKSTEPVSASTYTNIKIVAYMMDTSVWNKFAGENADYAIGGPTLELLFDSYNNKYETEYRYKVESIRGYHVSKDNGANWATYYSGMIDTCDAQYVLPSPDDEINPGKAYGMWLATPSTADTESLNFIRSDGYVHYRVYDFEPRLRFAPYSLSKL